MIYTEMYLPAACIEIALATGKLSESTNTQRIGKLLDFFGHVCRDIPTDIVWKEHRPNYEAVFF